MEIEPLESSIYKNRIVNSRIALRNDDIEHWLSSDVLLYPGEPAISYEIDRENPDHATCRLKVGRKGLNGEIYKWSQLPYINVDISDVIGIGEILSGTSYKFHQENNDLSLLQSLDGGKTWSYNSKHSLSNIELSIESMLSNKTWYDSLSSYEQVKSLLSNDSYALCTDIGTGILTITLSGKNPQTFSANSSTDVSIDISSVTDINWGLISGDLSNQTDLYSSLSSLSALTYDPFRTISLIKPYSDHPLFISVDISENKQFISSLIVDSRLSSTFFNGFSNGIWEQQPISGFGVQYNDNPIEIDFSNVLSYLGRTTNKDSKFYIRYSWYWKENETAYHNSDKYSLILPTNTEVGANSRDVASKREFTVLDNQVNILTKQVSESSEYAKHWMIDNFSFSEIQQVLSSSNTICLLDYNENNHYNVKFTTANEKNVVLSVDIDNGNGPESSTFDNDQLTFKPNSTYVIDFFHDDVIVKTINGEDFVKYTDSKVINLFKCVQMIKPYSENRMFCELTASLSGDFSNPLSVDSSISNTLFSGFLRNNVASEWVMQPLSGFTFDFNNQPIAFDLETLLTANSIYPTDKDLVYVKYKWYWIDNDHIRHRSDTYSSILPSNTEVGANSHDVVSKREFKTLENVVIPYALDVGLDPEFGTYPVNQYTFSNITCDISSGDKILLNDFNQYSNYRMRFNTTSADSNISVVFQVDRGNGPESDDELAINNNSFMPNTDYTIEVKYDSIVIDSINRRDVVNYLKENSNSVTLRIWNN